MENSEGRLLQNKYEIVSQITKGGFGIVYFGIDRIFEKPVAIKAIDPALLNDAKFVDLFLQEAKNAAKLSHHNIVHIFDLIRNEEGQFFIIMEFIQGFDLGRILRQCQKKSVRLPIDLSVFIIKEVCKALEYAHNKRDMLTNKPLKMVHQDLSPSNLMISLSGQVKLIDFGLAKIRLQHREHDQVVLSGKVPYLAPELFNNVMADRRSDIFSLGAIFYEMLTGERLIQTTDPKEAHNLFKKFKLDPKILAEHDTPEPLQKVLVKMLQKNCEDRYFGANGVYLDLIEFLMSSSHTVELSEELGEYLRELYREEMADQKQSEQSESIQSPANEVPSQQTSITDDSLSLATTSGDLSAKVETKQKTENNDLEIILQDIESRFSTSKKMSIVSPSTAAGKNTIKPKHPKASAIDREPQQLSPTPVQEKIKLNGDEDDDLKTVIDVMRLSARTHQKSVKYVVAIAIILLLTFLSLDFTFRLTPLGTYFNNQIFPPVISIDTVPQGAMVYLNSKRVAGKTPLSISKIDPGVHKLTLTYAGFGPIVKSIHVPAKGRANITGEAGAVNGLVYLFCFKSQIELNSNPTGATVYLNNVKFPQKTPTKINWETGEALEIEMEQEGFGKISGLTLNTLESSVKIDDERLWSFEQIDGSSKKYIVEGKFKKHIELSTIPDGVSWFVNGAKTPTGNAEDSNLLSLPFGKHDILFKKDGFNDKLISLSVDRDAPAKLAIILDRTIRFDAREVGATDSSHIKARISRYIANGRQYRINKETPCELSLPAVETRVFFEKEGYGESVVTVFPTDKEIVVVMSRTALDIEVVVNDALTGLPIPDAEIYYQLLPNAETSQALFGKTNENGKYASAVKPGKHNFLVKKEGYYDKQLALDTANGDRKLEFKLIIH
ncbi:MAG TPA: PEGA domain-containing protein [bacterium]|nr:PEGA domain-containing protein [bacterium]